MKFGIDPQGGTNIEYINKKYTEKLSNLLGTENFNKPLILKLGYNRSTYFSKFLLDIENPLFFKILNDTWTTQFQIKSINKSIKYINYDILPSFKITSTSTSLPISFYAKHANYRASAQQDFGNYDFSQLLKSLLPYNRTSVGIQYDDVYDFNSKNLTNLDCPKLVNMLNYTLKLKFNRIKAYEDSIKFCATTRYNKSLNIGDIFTLRFTNETFLRNSYILNVKGPGKVAEYGSSNTNIGSYNVSNEDAEIINPHHILSTNQAYSKILDLNINNVYKELNVGNKFWLSNYTQLKFKKIWLLKDFPIFDKFSPFIGFETIFVPIYEKNSNTKNLPLYKKINYEDSVKLVGNLGFAFQLDDKMSIDFTLKTFTKGFKSIDASVFDKFRMSMSVSIDF